MIFCEPRIAWSMGWGMVAMLLCALWLTSCWRFDQIIHRTAPGVYRAITSVRGKVAVAGLNDPRMSTVFSRDWLHLHFAMKDASATSGSPIAVFPVDPPESAVWIIPQFTSPFVRPISTPNYELTLPFWLLVVVAALAGSLPWLPYPARFRRLIAKIPGRFSLRTLLIATTLVAVVLGCVVWAVRS
jgi:hypothetical protein